MAKKNKTSDPIEKIEKPTPQASKPVLTYERIKAGLKSYQEKHAKNTPV